MSDGYRILVIEDDETDGSVIAAVLEGICASCDLVTDGDEAVEYLTATGRYSGRAEEPWPDLILLDLGLPSRTGHNVLRWIRWEAGVTQTPVVVLTASHEPADIRQAYRFGANSYLLKPRGAEELARVAEAVVEYWLRWNISGVSVGA